VSPGGRPGGPLVHHGLCFGCGQANLFGLLAELERRDDGSIAGRCFLKQDHQGPDPGSAHPGVVAAALAEAMLLAAGPGATLATLEVHFEAPAPVGAFLELQGTADRAVATADGHAIASARATRG
jgi:hypothetical protein